MFRNMVKKVFGDPMERAVNKYRSIVDKINALEPELQKLTDDELANKTNELKQRLENGETLDDILVEAYAVVREASVRTVGMRHYDVQMIGGIVLHEGRIGEMKTGEGKTLVATLPIYLNALSGKGVHLVTPNDYLSKYGLQTMGEVYSFLGLSASVIQNTGGKPNTGSYIFDKEYVSADDRYQNLRPITRPEAYQTDITYGTNNEFGFDYLRDNMAWEPARLAQRELNFAIIDEVDNILIDEARTPLIISGPADEPSDYYAQFSQIVKKLKKSSPESVDDEEPDGDYVVDEKDRISYLSEQGVERVESMMGSAGMLKADQLYHPDNSEMIPYLDNCLRARALYHIDKEYVVQDGQVVIVDDFTGRLMPGRRFSEGLHQAIEAKEGVKIRRENITMATITFQNFFRMYDKLGGMTGTALTEQEEFEKIYELDVIAIPTNLPIVRQDQNDFIYVNMKAKWNAVVSEIKARSENGQPVLVGTVAIETSEELSKLLKRAGVKHEVLNAKQHEREASIITQAGRPGAVTIATNMAGRGVDILLGGNPEGIAREILRKKHGLDVTEASPEQWEEALQEATAQTEAGRQQVLDAGGLYVLGTERHDSRRIDNQLRGRSGRQGDKGETRFFLSLEDDLIRRFNGEQVKNILSWANLPDDEPLEHGLVSKSIEQAQIRVEGHNFDIRKRVLEFDDVVNRQREIIYAQRKDWLDYEYKDLFEQYLEIVETRILETIDDNDIYETDDMMEWDVDLLYKDLLKVFPVPQEINPDTMEQMSKDELTEKLLVAAKTALKIKETTIESAQEGLFDRALRMTILRAVDTHWQRHLTALDILREGIGLMSIAQRDPVVEYKRDAFMMFEQLQDQINEQAARQIFMVQATIRQPVRRQMNTSRPNLIASGGGNSGDQSVLKTVRNERKIGRNDPCWCGSGKKYKNCHYKIDKANAKVNA